MAHPEDGFSLVEMLVALSLLAMAASLMGVAFASSSALWRRIDQSSLRGETIQSAQTLIRARIERLNPKTAFARTKPYADIVGSADRLSFWALAPDAERPAPIRRYSLMLRDDGDLVLEWTPRPSIDPDAESSEPVQNILLHNVRDLEIAYFGPDDGGGAPLWQDSWIRRAAPPQLIRIKVAFGAGDPRLWPEMLAAPATVLDTLCTLDPATGRCRNRT
jgi:general secretion pathway protein J